MHLFILYNLQLEIINFLYKNLRKANCYRQQVKRTPPLKHLTTENV